MAYADMQEEDEARRRAMGVGPTTPAAGGAPATSGAQAGAPAAPQAPAGQGTGFVNFNALLGLNSAGGQQMAQGLADNLGQRAAGAKDATAANGVRAQAGQMTGGGLGTLLQEQYGQGRHYSGGENALDAALVGQAGGSTLRDASSAYGHFAPLLGLPARGYMDVPGGLPIDNADMETPLARRRERPDRSRTHGRRDGSLYSPDRYGR